mmetsp:Transcript_50253/g.162847  ORF Transcript_50253/g.162847 Transcript_50253/m.162847 type:complete len:260 (+) Transcript_50253:326-1105(+)
MRAGNHFACLPCIARPGADETRSPSAYVAFAAGEAGEAGEAGLATLPCRRRLLSGASSSSSSSSSSFLVGGWATSADGLPGAGAKASISRAWRARSRFEASTHGALASLERDLHFAPSALPASPKESGAYSAACRSSLDQSMYAEATPFGAPAAFLARFPAGLPSGLAADLAASFGSAAASLPPASASPPGRAAAARGFVAGVPTGTSREEMSRPSRASTAHCRCSASSSSSPPIVAAVTETPSTDRYRVSSAAAFAGL